MSMRQPEMSTHYPAIPIKRLSHFDHPRITHHFLALGGDDRRLRFGAGQTDSAVRAYVNGINFEHDAMFGVLDDDLRLIGVAHLAHNDDHAELGISVLVANRDRGIGAALLKCAHTHARNRGVHRLFMHCLAENGAMIHLAKRERMDVVAEAGEADAWLKLRPPDACSYITAAVEQHVGHFYYALKRQRVGLRRLIDDLASPAQGRDLDLS
jgi:RimJ/RimL family protein N-acetyltransferase